MVKSNHGHIVTVASVASFLAIAPTVAYSCSKAGVLAFHEALTNELKVRYDAPKVRTTYVSLASFKSAIYENIN
jgi:all-trans-retinol dehydrogenase (NAD+)